MIESQEVSHVIVNDLSRLARNVRITLEAVELMQKNDVTFISLSEDINTESAVGRCFLVIASAFAQMMRDQTSEKMSVMHEQNRMNGRSGPGFVPLGLVKQNRKLVIDEAECQVVQKIFDLKGAGLSYRAIARQLDRDGASTKRQGRWAPSTIKSVIQTSQSHPLIMSRLKLV